jgi:NAD(P)-dependent dehydrogenase (short-subunit alcohol dehydrogenase family)
LKNGQAAHAALVTGASRGIGRAIAQKLAADGFSIALNAPVEDEDLAASVEQLSGFGVSVITSVFDVTDLSVHSRKLEEVEEALGPLTTLVNNAGVGVAQRGDLLDVTEESFDRCMNVNAKALFFLSQCFAKRLLNRARNEALYHSIINVTSANAKAVAETRAEYCASKTAASMATLALAARLGRENIAVFDIQPGLIETAMTAPVIADYKQRAEAGLCILPRVGQPADVGKVAATLARGDLPYMTGQVIAVDGGMLVPRF